MKWSMKPSSFYGSSIQKRLLTLMASVASSILTGGNFIFVENFWTSSVQLCQSVMPWQSQIRGFHKCTALPIMAILTFLCSIVLVNAIFYVTGHTFPGWILQWSSKFQMTTKIQMQYCHSCIAESLWKPRMSDPHEVILYWIQRFVQFPSGATLFFVEIF